MQTVDLISVIIPVYNAQGYLAQCLASVLANTWQALEILCVNDGSTDRSEQILRDFAQRDERVVLVSQPNSGVSAARNAGLKRAHGDCVAFIDADDFVAPDYFSSLAQGLTRTGADIAACGYYKGGDAVLAEAARAGAGEEAAVFTPCGDRVPADPYLLNYIWGRLYRADCLTGAAFPEELSLGEDTAFNIQVYARAQAPKLVFTDKKMYFYRIGNPHSLTQFEDHTKIIRRAEWCLTQYDALDDCAKAIYLDIAFKSLWAYRYLTTFSGGDRFKSKALGRQCRRKAKALPLSLTTRLKYTVFTAVPQSYRLFRLLTDRTLIQWEKEQKKAARERKAAGQKQGETHE